ncbi:hypothetical protein SLEP1_g49247 [Rubroshorea leprosula]|uniref:Uncharacterized protein n=1 Tax=Rubroshorea leprosula TaxID=152421 RepID=A0AAV5LWD4_9ROSI|nr:hypothetical protein SLEP1_g49247 [Rubroshorea leprosula]
MIRFCFCDGESGKKKKKKSKLQVAGLRRPVGKNPPGEFTGSTGSTGWDDFPGFGRSNRLNGPGCSPSPFYPPGDGWTG